MNKYIFKRSWVLLLMVLFAYACSKEEKITNSTTTAVLDETPYIISHEGLPPPKLPPDNKLTVQKIKLGRMLFYETMLSKDGSMSCASCHRQKDGFSDTSLFSIGVEGLPGKRQAMAVFNMAWNNNEFFWDGRAHLLRDQSLKPIQDPLEMNETLDNVVLKLSTNNSYQDQFIRAFGSTEVTPEKMSLALEQFMFTIVSNKSKHDRVMAGMDTYSPSEARGRDLFFQEYNPFFPDQSGADCAHCHMGPNFENDRYLNNGLDGDGEITDIGREEVTGNAMDKAKFKVPSLRNVELTPPYMHDGRFTSLEQVVEHYNSGLKASTYLDPALENTRIKGLMLSDQDKTDLVNFMKTLTDQSLQSNPDHSDPFIL